jgi:hypothetical protein
MLHQFNHCRADIRVRILNTHIEQNAAHEGPKLDTLFKPTEYYHDSNTLIKRTFNKVLFPAFYLLKCNTPSFTELSPS